MRRTLHDAMYIDLSKISTASLLGSMTDFLHFLLLAWVKNHMQSFVISTTPVLHRQAGQTHTAPVNTGNEL